MTRAALLLVIASMAIPHASAAQRVTDVMGIVRDGGGWVGIPVEAGVGRYSTGTVPTMGLSVNGCVQVAPEHSGEWVISAKDHVAQAGLTLETPPGTGVPFAHSCGRQAQLDFEVRWSEPRDTTLVMWVGLALGAEGNTAACGPSEGG